jgi:uncharacterized protein (DUF934 family)
MSQLLRRGEPAVDEWRPAQPELSAEQALARPRQILTLDQWLSTESGTAAGLGLQLEPGQSPEPLFGQLGRFDLIVIHFHAFTDGRGFSYARALRQHGYGGELRAGGSFIPDQLHYLARCGFDAFELDDRVEAEEARAALHAFSESYQASADTPLPLFRRRP